jgi:hypothetical protein
VLDGTNQWGDIIYFVDDINRPRKINVSRALDGQYASASQEMISAIMQPPAAAPEIELTQRPEIVTNNIWDKAFQFAYRYLYVDGEISVYSPISKPAIDEFFQTFDGGSREQYLGTANTVTVTCKYSNIFVKTNEIIARSGNDGTWYKVHEQENDPNILEFDFLFSNTGNYAAAIVDEVVGNYDYVPLRAAALEYIEDRIVYTNAVDSYDNISMQSTFKYATAFNKEGDIIRQQDGVRESISIGGFTNIGLTYNCNTLTPFVLGESVKLVFSAVVTITNTVTGVVTSKNVNYTIVHLISSASSATTVSTALSTKINSLGLAGAASPYFPIPDSGRLYYVLSGALTSPNETYDIQVNAGSGIFVTALNQQFNTWKSGSFYGMGAVYYDEYLQDGGVQKTENTTVYIPFFTERPTYQHGPAKIDNRMLHKPPIWAKGYRLVTTGNQTTRDYIQYNIIRTYAVNPNSPSAPSSGQKDALYLSLSSLKGEPGSYREMKGAEIDYNFVEGDRLRVLFLYSFLSNIPSFVSTYIDIRVIDFVFLEPDGELNPLYDNSLSATEKENRVGWYLVVEDPKIAGWSTASLSGSNFWNDGNTMPVVEIYRPFKEVDNPPYFEVSDMLEIGDAGTETRFHGGNVRNQGVQTTKTLTGVVFSRGDQNIQLSYDSTVGTPVETRFVVGDKIVVNQSGDTFEVTDVIVEIGDDIIELLVVRLTGTTLPSSGNTISLLELSSATELTCGDTYWRLRRYGLGTSPYGLELFFIAPCEALEYSDFIRNSRHWCMGRAHFYSVHNRQQRRPASMYISQPFQRFMQFNGLSTIRAINGQFKDYTAEYGGVQKLFKDGDSLYVVFESKTMRIGVSKQIIETSDGQQMITLNRELLSDLNAYAGDYGVNNAQEACAMVDGKLYLNDVRRGMFLRLSTDGFTPISDYGAARASSFATPEMLSVLNSRVIRFPVGVTPDTKDVYFTRSGMFLRRMTSVTRGLCRTYVPELVLTLDEVLADSTGTFPSAYRVISNVPERQSLRQIIETGYINISEENWYLGNVVDFELEIACDNGFVIADATYNKLTGVVEFKMLHDTTQVFTINDTVNISPDTIAFHEAENAWFSRFSFTPNEQYVNLGQYMYSFKNGHIWTHDSSTRGNYYGVQYPHFYDMVFNGYIDVRKFKDISLQSTAPYDVFAETDLSETSWLNTEFEKKESFYYKDMPFDTSQASSAHILPLGAVTAVVGSIVTIQGFHPSSVGVYLDEEVYYDDTVIGTVASLNVNQVELNLTGSVAVGNFLYVKRPQITSGDFVRGHYLRVKLQREITTPIELFGVTTLEAESEYYHNLTND